MTSALLLSHLTVTMLACKQDEASTEQPPDLVPESPTLALTPTEYNNTVRDLLRMDLDGSGWPSPSSVGSSASSAWPWELPAEPGIGGFEGIAAGQAPSTYQIERLHGGAQHFAAYAAASEEFYRCEEPSSLSLEEQESCGWESLSRFAQRAWRRTMTDAEEQELRSIWDQHWADYSLEEAIVLSVTAVLMTPQFLYRIEEGDAEAQIDDARPLTDWEMASRLSYFLWDSMPDDELFAAASQGELSSREEVMDQARRMLDDDRAREAVTHFHRQWLGIQDIHTISPARSAYGPRYGLSADTALDTTDDYDWPYVLIHVRNSMALETDLFIERTLFDGSGRFETLMTDHHGYVSSYTRPLYGSQVEELEGDRVTWYESDYYDVYGQDFYLSLYPARFSADERAGVLTLPSVLALNSYTVHPAPVQRGTFFLEMMTCQELGQPPAEAEGSAPPDTLEADATNRERTEAVTSPDECMSCHQTINPPGFAFEHYDAMGAWRQQDNGQTVDSSGSFTLASGETFTFSNGVELAHQLASSPTALDCYTLRWLRYALGIQLEEHDPGVQELQEQFRESDDVLELLIQITGSDLFRYRNAGGQP